MKSALSLPALLEEVQRQTSAKKDYVTSTRDNVRLIQADDLRNKIGLVLLKEGATELERFAITDNAHEQIAAKLDIPRKHYYRLLADHCDLICNEVNKLFEREPASRLIRVLDGKVRAFLSDRYLRLDNNEVLAETLPVIVKGEIQTQLLNCNVDDNSLNIKCLFTDPRFEHLITNKTRTGAPRIIKPGFHLSNSETGRGTLSLRGFFYDGYCKNGAVYNYVEGFEFRRSHIGGKLIEGVQYEVLSEKSKKLEDATIISQVNDVLKALADPALVEKLAAQLRAAANTEPAKNPVAAVDLAVKELSLLESEKTQVLTTFLQDGDYSKWGLASAVTSVANNEDVSYDRSTELEEIGGKILSLELRNWQRYVDAEVVPARSESKKLAA